MIDAIRVGDTVISSDDMSKAVQHLKKFCSFFEQDKQAEIFKTIMEEFFQRQFVKQLGSTIPKSETNTSLTRFDTEFTIIDTLSETSNEKVYSAINHIDRCAYAIKKIHFSIEDVKPEVIMQEAVLMQELIHPNIVRYLTSWIEFEFKKGTASEENAEEIPFEKDVEFHFFIQEELCSKENILDVSKDYDIAQRIDLLLDTASGINYLHENQVIHNNLKPSDILISLDGIPKICNFSKSLNLKLENLTGILPTTTIYTAPEAIASPSIKADIFSFAIISIEVLTGSNEIATAASVKHEQIHNDNIPQDLLYILWMASSPNPYDRPSISDIMSVMSKVSDDYLDDE